MKIWRLVSEKFFLKSKLFFSGPPFTGGPDAKILFLSAQRPPTAHKISSPPDLPFWRYGGQSFNFPSLPQILGGQIPSIFCKGYTRDNLQKPWKFCKSLANSFRDIRLFTVRAYSWDTIVSSTLKAESLYSDEYSFTLVMKPHSISEAFSWRQQLPFERKSLTGEWFSHSWWSWSLLRRQRQSATTVHLTTTTLS